MHTKPMDTKAADTKFSRQQTPSPEQRMPSQWISSQGLWSQGLSNQWTSSQRIPGISQNWQGLWTTSLGFHIPVHFFNAARPKTSYAPRLGQRASGLSFFGTSRGRPCHQDRFAGGPFWRLAHQPSGGGHLHCAGALSWFSLASCFPFCALCEFDLHREAAWKCKLRDGSGNPCAGRSFSKRLLAAIRGMSLTGLALAINMRACKPTICASLGRPTLARSPFAVPTMDSTSVVHAKNDSVVHAKVFSHIHALWGITQNVTQIHTRFDCLWKAIESICLVHVICQKEVLWHETQHGPQETAWKVWREPVGPLG